MKPGKKTLYSIIFSLSTLLILLPLFDRSIFEKFKAFGLLGIFFINLLGSATVLIPTPSILSVGVGGTLYNPILVALLASCGSSIGESVGFFFGYSSKEVLDLKKQKIFSILHDLLLRRYGFLVILFFSFIPNPFFDGIGILVGMSSYSLKKFLILVFIGRFFRNILIAYFGSSL